MPRSVIVARGRGGAGARGRGGAGAHVWSNPVPAVASSGPRARLHAGRRGRSRRPAAQQSQTHRTQTRRASAPRGAR